MISRNWSIYRAKTFALYCIYIYRIVNENILEKQKIREKEKNNDVIVPQQQEQRKLEKNLCQRTKRRKV